VNEELSVAGTKVVQSRFSVRRPDNAILRAPSVAHVQHLTFAAIARQRFLLGLSKGLLGRAFQQIEQRRLADVPQTVHRGDEVITLIKIAIVLDDRNIPAGGSEDAQRMILAIRRPGGFFKALDDDPPDVLPDPFIEDGAEKGAEGFRRRRALAHADRGFRPWFNERNEAQILSLDLLEKVVDLERVLDVFRMYNT